MDIRVDFEVDSELAVLYCDALANEYTSETKLSGKTFSLEETAKRLELIAKTHKKNGYVLHGILKVYIDNTLAAISFPREMLPEEYDKYDLKSVNTYHRMSGIFIKEEYRGQGLGLKILNWFIKEYKHVMWAADVENLSSIKVALKAGLEEVKTLEEKDSEGNVYEELKIFRT